MKIVITLLLSFVVLVPTTLTLAQTPETQLAQSGFVQCEGKDCSACDLVALANSLVKWLITISFLFFAVLAVRAGVKLVISQGNPGALSDAKDAFTNAFIGLIIILIAWLIVDTLMRQLIGNNGVINGYGPWSEVQCATQVVPGLVPGYFSGDEEYQERVTAAGDNTNAFTTVDVTSRVGGISASPAVTAMVNAALDEMGITDPYQRKIYRALISQESSNCQNKVGPDTGKGRGRAYGCSQFLVATARSFDSKLDRKFQGKSDAEVASILTNDNTYSIRLGALYYREALKNYNGNIDYAVASYNGGPGSNKKSTTCPGQTQWQCTANKGYAQTRHYVANIKAVAGGI